MRPAFILLLLLGLASCDYLKPDPDRIPLARVNDTYLYADEVRSLMNESAGAQDSARRVSAYINRWATRQLLIDQALINLPDEQLDRFEELVNDYRNDLYSEAYKNAIVARQLDSTISEIELRTYYEQNKENFRLNEELITLRFIHLDPLYSDISGIRRMLERFEPKDQMVLDSLRLQFRNYNLNDSAWVRKPRLLATLPVLADSERELLKNSNFTQLQDSLGVYLVKINEVLRANDIAPLAYVRPTIREILLNRRKLELIRQLETDITKDAIQDKRFEIYNGN